MLIFLVPGYGIPGGDILVDGNYNAYLHAVLAAAFDALSADPRATLTIVCSGGHSDMVAPYERTEAGEMERWFRAKLVREVFAGIRGRIEIRREERALSSLDNVVRFREMGIGLAPGDRTIVFCEQTRRDRMLSLVSRVLITEQADFEVRPVDFDQTDNRFRDPAFVRQREDAECRVAARALSSEADLADCRLLYERRIAKLREVGPGQAHVEAVMDWWKAELAAFADDADPS